MPYEKIANTTSGLVELLGFLGHDSLTKKPGIVIIQQSNLVMLLYWLLVANT